MFKTYERMARVAKGEECPKCGGRKVCEDWCSEKYNEREEPQPKNIEAAHFPKAGTYALDGQPITIEQDDTYVVKTSDGYETRTGQYFRASWREAS